MTEVHAALFSVCECARTVSRDRLDERAGFRRGSREERKQVVFSPAIHRRSKDGGEFPLSGRFRALSFVSTDSPRLAFVIGCIRYLALAKEPRQCAEEAGCSARGPHATPPFVLFPLRAPSGGGGQLNCGAVKCTVCVLTHLADCIPKRRR